MPPAGDARGGAAPARAPRGTRPGMSGFALKVIAIVGMTADHAGIIFEDALPFPLACALQALGGLTFPIMAFLLVEGYRHTSSVRRYATRLLAFAAVSQVPFSLAFPPESVSLGSLVLTPPVTGNVLFTLALGLALLWAHDHVRPRAAFWALACLAVAASSVLDWGIIGPVMVLAIGLASPGRARALMASAIPACALGIPALGAVLAGDVSQLPAALYGLVGCTCAGVALALYDGSRGRPMRWFFYAYYPAHIAALALAHALLLG